MDRRQKVETKLELPIFDERNLLYEDKCIAVWMLQTLVKLRLWNPTGEEYVIDLFSTYQVEDVIYLMEYYVKEQREKAEAAREQDEQS